MKRKKTALLVAIALGYLAGIYQGQVALWRGEDPEPERIFPYSASLLPPDDQAALAHGIRIESPAALQQFLEDFAAK